MLIKMLALIALLAISGCANINGTKTSTDPTTGIITVDHIRITTMFSKSTLSNFKGNYVTAGKSSALVSFSSGESSAQIEEMGTAFGAAAATALEKAVKGK